jgi:hypothetical protein
MPDSPNADGRAAQGPDNPRPELAAPEAENPQPAVQKAPATSEEKSEPVSSEPGAQPRAQPPPAVLKRWRSRYRRSVALGIIGRGMGITAFVLYPRVPEATAYPDADLGSALLATALARTHLAWRQPEPLSWACATPMVGRVCGRRPEAAPLPAIGAAVNRGAGQGGATRFESPSCHRRVAAGYRGCRADTSNRR